MQTTPLACWMKEQTLEMLLITMFMNIPCIAQQTVKFKKKQALNVMVCKYLSWLICGRKGEFFPT